MPRWMDVVLATVGLTLMLPLLALVALVIWLTSGRPILFRQERVGRGGRPIHVYKFRTMDPNAGGGPLTRGPDDPRVTTTGRALRSSKLDELPQLWNVLRGDMKLVGPRPEVPFFTQMYDDHQRTVLSVPPGITDPASIAYSDESRLLASVADPERMYVEEILPRKLALTTAYLHERSCWTDILVLGQTLRKVMLRA